MRIARNKSNEGGPIVCREHGQGGGGVNRSIMRWNPIRGGSSSLNRKIERRRRNAGNWGKSEMI